VREGHLKIFKWVRGGGNLAGGNDPTGGVDAPSPEPGDRGVGEALALRVRSFLLHNLPLEEGRPAGGSLRV
jgi:hypothetical protein